jgi:hypothetical protein
MGEIDLTWIAALPDHAIEFVLDSLYDCTGHELRQALEDERWGRHSEPITEWPRLKETLHPNIQLIRICNAVERDDPRGYEKLDLRGPDDPAHRPLRRRDHEVLCSCGARSENNYKRYRISRTWWWPVEVLDGVPHFNMCPRAKDVEDPHHAPSTIWKPENLIHCICGWEGLHQPENRCLRPTH